MTSLHGPSKAAGSTVYDNRNTTWLSVDSSMPIGGVLQLSSIGKET